MGMCLTRLEQVVAEQNTNGLRCQVGYEVNASIKDQLGPPELIIATKGAPEAIAVLCRLPERDRAEIRRALDEMAGKHARARRCTCIGINRYCAPGNAAQISV
jgi:hypothetical protein